MPCSTASFSVKLCRAARQYLDLVSNVALLPCQTQFINYKYIRTDTFKSLLNPFFIFVFCFRQQPFYSTELNSTYETTSCYCRAAVELQSSQLSTTGARPLKQALRFSHCTRISSRPTDVDKFPLFFPYKSVSRLVVDK